MTQRLSTCQNKSNKKLKLHKRYPQIRTQFCNLKTPFSSKKRPNPQFLKSKAARHSFRRSKSSFKTSVTPASS